jgi:hypothetical protein
MKKLVTCASLAAIGAVGLQAQYVGGLAPEKSWSISARLRGFFDDNYATLPGHLDAGDWMQIPDSTGKIPGAPGYVQTLEKRGPTKRGSWGMLAGVTGSYSPKLGELTTIGASVRYDMYYYEDRRTGQEDHNVQAGLNFSHQFSDRYKLDASDTFVMAQEPQVLDPSPMTVSPLRSEGSNIRNTASLVDSAKLTSKLDVKGSYANTIYDYEQDGDGSRSALLDKMIHSVDLQLRWAFRPNTTGYVAYRFDYIDMTSNDRLWNALQENSYVAVASALVSPTAANYAATTNFLSNPAVAHRPPTSSIRDNYSHFAYLGVDHEFNVFLNAQVKVGGQYTEFPNALERVVVARTDGTGNVLATRVRARDNMVPYADINIRYDYAKDCSLQLGFVHSRNSTDVAQIGNPTDLDSLIGLLLGEYTTLDQESTTAYGAISQKVTAKLRLTLRGQWQGSMFNQKNLTGVEDNYAGVDLKADYEINKFLFAEAGYGFDVLASDLPDRGFTRNRFFVGVRGTY